MQLTAKDVMQFPVKSISSDATVWEATEKLRAAGITGAPVVDGKGKPLGVFTLNDLANYVLSTRGDFKVTDFMTRGVVTVAPTAGVYDIVRAMRRHQVHRVFVASENGDILGIVTPLDVMGAEEPAALAKR